MFSLKSLTKLLTVCRPLWNHQSASMAFDSSNKIHQKINDLITKSDKKIFLFMKGTPQEPMCRYSGVTVQVLEAYGFDFDSYNILEDEDIRQAIKEYSDWPTIPQVYKDGKFIGGCDILLQMHQNGELKEMAELENETKQPQEKK